MRALVKESAGPGMVLRDVPRPTCGPNDVLIRVHYAGVCGTDLHIWEWDAWASGRLKPPLTIGHEFAGEIVELGPEAGATGLLAIGDRVTAEGHIVCGHCLPCRTGDAHVCRRTSIIGVDRDGAFAEYIAMPASNVIRLETIPTEVGAIMDPIGNAVHTVLEGGNLPGSTVLVVGCGPIGCFAVGIARAAGASLVLASDLNPRRLEIARRMGAHVVLDASKEDVVARTTEVNFARDVIFKGLTIYGVTGRRMYDTWHQMTRLIRARQFDPAPVVTHRFPLERIADAIGVIKDGSAGKVILEIGA